MVYTGSYWCVIGVIDRATALSTTAVTPSATGSWYYSSAISSLANYDEIRVWLEIADGEKGWITLTRKDSAETVHTLYLTASYNARVQLKWDTTNNKVGVYAVSYTHLDVYKRQNYEKKKEIRIKYIVCK